MKQEHLEILRCFFDLKESSWKHVGVTASVPKGDMRQHMHTSGFYYFYNTRLCKGISHLPSEMLCHVMIQSYEKYCRVDLT